MSEQNGSRAMYHNTCQRICKFGARAHVRSTCQKICQNTCQTSRQDCQNTCRRQNTNMSPRLMCQNTRTHRSGENKEHVPGRHMSSVGDRSNPLQSAPSGPRGGPIRLRPVCVFTQLSSVQCSRSWTLICVAVAVRLHSGGASSAPVLRILCKQTALHVLHFSWVVGAALERLVPPPKTLSGAIGPLTSLVC